MENVSDLEPEQHGASGGRSISSTKKENIRPPKLCMYYSNYEFCKYGDNCKFLHGRKPAPRRYVSKSFNKPNMERNQTENTTPISNENEKFTFRGDQRYPKKSKQLCRFYKAGHCDQGDKCLYSHSLYNNDSLYNNVPLQSFMNPSKDTPRASSSKNNSVPICQYFKRGFCNKGDRCKFYHPQKCTPTERYKYSSREIDQNSFNWREDNRHKNVKSYLNRAENDNANFSNNIEFETDDSKINENINLCEITDNKCTEDLLPRHEIPTSGPVLENDFSKDVRRPLIAKQVFQLSVSDSEIPQLRSTEIKQFIKRFPSYEIIEEDRLFSFIFQPTDPDWPFDTKMITLQVMFPEQYPREICDINVIGSDDYIPEELFKHLNQSILDWLNKRHEVYVESNQIELVFRPFLKWFDRNLEEMFNTGLKRVKQAIVTDQDNELDSTQVICQQPDATDVDEEKSYLIPESSGEEVQLTEEMEKSSICEQKPNQNAFICSNQNQGVKVLFVGLEFIEGVAALTCTKISATLQCIRCKTSLNIKSSPNRNNSLTCSKCSKIIECNFNPSLLHQFSNVLGTMHLVECQVVDINLVECAFLVDCLNCSKQVGADGIHYGQKQKLWCRFCNQKLIIGIGSVKFQATAPTYTASKAADKPVKKTEKKKDPLIKEGSPLPQFGACKHYKKSNRWLRFPCCGRVYPCDVCHEEKESDHEMKFASRMICGFCSKEQPYSKDKPCTTCGSGVVAKSGTHWEGGKGCRNKTKMSRDDKHKYAGSCKTVSKKAQGSGNKKK